MQVFFSLFLNFFWDGSIVVIEVLIMLSNRPQNPAGIAHRHHIGGDIFGHHAASTDDGIVADGDTGHDDDAGAQPAVGADVDRQIVLQATAAQVGIDGMAGGGHFPAPAGSKGFGPGRHIPRRKQSDHILPFPRGFPGDVAAL